MRSVAFSSKSGWVDAMYRAKRWGFRSASRHARWTRSLLMLRCPASFRHDQWVDPSGGGRRVAFKIRARKRAVSFHAVRPGRCVSSASTPFGEEPLFPLRHGRRRRVYRAAVTRTEHPSANNNTILARQTTPGGKPCECAISTSSERCVDDNWMSFPSNGMQRRRRRYVKRFSATVH